MRIFKLTCNESQIQGCATSIYAKHPTALGISHIADHHIVTFPEDYNNKGKLIDHDVHLLCWQLGGVDVTKGKDRITAPDKTTNPLNKKQREIL
jgi:hypothetical protein